LPAPPLFDIFAAYFIDAAAITPPLLITPCCCFFFHMIFLAATPLILLPSYCYVYALRFQRHADACDASPLLIFR